MSFNSCRGESVIFTQRLLDATALPLMARLHPTEQDTGICRVAMYTNAIGGEQMCASKT
jgi:hypothetical protein